MNNTTAIKQYKKLTMIKLKSWRLLRTPASKEEVQKFLADKSKDYLMIDGVGFNRMTEVAEFFEFVPDDMECFILSQPDPITRERLREILEERKKGNHKTNGISHLREIYEKRFLQDSTN